MEAQTGETEPLVTSPRFKEAAFTAEHSVENIALAASTESDFTEIDADLDVVPEATDSNEAAAFNKDYDQPTTQTLEGSDTDQGIIEEDVYIDRGDGDDTNEEDNDQYHDRDKDRGDDEEGCVGPDEMEEEDEDEDEEEEEDDDTGFNSRFRNLPRRSSVEHLMEKTRRLPEMGSSSGTIEEDAGDNAGLIDKGADIIHDESDNRLGDDGGSSDAPDYAVGPLSHKTDLGRMSLGSLQSYQTEERAPSSRTEVADSVIEGPDGVLSPIAKDSEMGAGAEGQGAESSAEHVFNTLGNNEEAQQVRMASGKDQDRLVVGDSVMTSTLPLVSHSHHHHNQNHHYEGIDPDSSVEEASVPIHSLNEPRVQISVSCRLLKSTPPKKTSVICAIYALRSNQEWAFEGVTEISRGNTSPSFIRSFVLQYEPHKVFRIVVYDSEQPKLNIQTDSRYGTIEFSLESLVNAPEKQLTKKISSQEDGAKREGFVTIVGNIINCLIRFQIGGEFLKNIENSQEPDTLFVLSRVEHRETGKLSRPVYFSECVEKSISPVFKYVEVPFSCVFSSENASDHLEIGIFEVNMGISNLIGTVSFTVFDLVVQRKTRFKLRNDIVSENENNSEGFIEILKFEIRDTSTDLFQPKESVSLSKQPRRIHLKQTQEHIKPIQLVSNFDFTNLQARMDSLKHLADQMQREAVEEITLEADHVLSQITKDLLPNENARTYFRENGGLATLVKMMKSRDKIISKPILGLMKFLTSNGDTRKELVKAGILPVLSIHLYSAYDEDLKRLAIWNIAHLCRNEPKNKVAIKDLGILPLLIGLLKSSDTDMVSLCCWTLSTIVFKDLENKDAFRVLGGLNQLVSVIASRNPKTQIESIQALINVCEGHDENKKYACEIGAIPPLVDLLTNYDEKFQEIGAYAICVVIQNIQLGRDHMREFHGLKHLIHIMGSSSVSVKFVALSALRNAVFQDEINKGEAVKLQAIQILLQLVDEDKRLRPECIALLRNVCMNEPFRELLRKESNPKFLMEVFPPPPNASQPAKRPPR